MRSKIRNLRYSSLAILFLAASSAVSGQVSDRAEAGIEATLYVVQGSSEIADGKRLPLEITQDRKRLPHVFNGQQLRLANSSFARMGVGGSVDQKSLVLLSGPRINSRVAANLAWQMRGVHERSSADGAAALKVSSFNFTARIPYFVDAPEGVPERTAFQAIGLGLDQLSLPESVPTLIGTVSLPESSGTLYLYLVVKRVR